jgi:hypothetical protein
MELRNPLPQAHGRVGHGTDDVALAWKAGAQRGEFDTG